MHHFCSREHDCLTAQLLPFWIHQHLYWGHASCGLLAANDWAQRGHGWRHFSAQCCTLLTDGHDLRTSHQPSQTFLDSRNFFDSWSLTLFLPPPSASNVSNLHHHLKVLPLSLSPFPSSFIGIPHYKCIAHLISFWKAQIITEEIMFYLSLFFQHFRECQVHSVEVISNPFYT